MSSALWVIGSLLLAILVHTGSLARISDYVASARPVDFWKELVASQPAAGQPAASKVAATKEIAGFFPSNDAILLVDGVEYWVQDANRHWSLSVSEPQTLRFSVSPGDHWTEDADNSERSEICSSRLYAPGRPIRLSYDFMIEPGAPNSAQWMVVGQFHADDHWTSPPVAIELIGDRMAVGVRYHGLESDAPLYVYTDAETIERGRYYGFRIEVNFATDEKGYLAVWRDGIQIVDYHGRLGYGGRVYWKEGVYRAPAREKVAVDFRKLSIAPDEPVKSSLRLQSWRHE
jgi:hypothetical protein